MLRGPAAFPAMVQPFRSCKGLPLNGVFCLRIYLINNYNIIIFIEKGRAASSQTWLGMSRAGSCSKTFFCHPERSE
jgi:hypothetical protein